jgi:hypothetical protein
MGALSIETGINRPDQPTLKPRQSIKNADIGKLRKCPVGLKLVR